MSRRGLGRGLDALLSSTEEEAPAGLQAVPVADIRPNPYQPRQEIADEALAELTASVRAHGLIQPLIVTRGEEDDLVLIAGERRWRAARAAGLERVPVVVREAHPREMLALAIVENVQRSDLNTMEAAEAFARLMREFDLTQAEVADLVGKSRTAVANTVRLLKLDPEVQQLVADGHLTEGHGRALLAAGDAEAQRALAKQALKGGWTVRRTEAAAREAGAPADAPAAPKPSADTDGPRDPNTVAAERQLQEALGTRVDIRRKGDGGRVVIHFYSEEELAAIYERLASDE